ncbi:hypothetical protein [Streptomyces soliscabiei]|uniref:hypothetical protein n=1 Tax=Streptomyces soliscabiei TaxID=588897 RepID=UPI0029BF8392|nr:hypothetical protein [Streptomyces sp. NY05-11A]MDX2681563.1 hypothetical protein [Streptomyces sp. NY05-11A]
MAITEYDAAWYYEPAKAAQNPVRTQLALCLPGSVKRPAHMIGTYRLQTDGRYHPFDWARAQRPAEVMDDQRICPPTQRGQLALFATPYQLQEHHAALIRDRFQPDLERVKPLVDAVQAEHRLSQTWRKSALRALALALAARDAAGQDLVTAAILDALPHRRAGVAAVLDRAGLLAPGLDHEVTVLPAEERPRAQPRPRSCEHCQSWGRARLCMACAQWRRVRPGPDGECARCNAGPLPLRDGWCRDCLRQGLELGPATDTTSWRQLRLAGPAMPSRGHPRYREPAHPDRPVLDPPAEQAAGQQVFFEAERDWRPLVGALLPPPPPRVRALLSDFARYTTEHGWTTDSAETMARLLRIAATWMGTDAPYREEDLQALNHAHGSLGRPRGLMAFLRQRGQLLPEPPRRDRNEALVQRTIAALPTRIRDELSTWVTVLRADTRPQHRATDYGTVRRYLVYLTPTLADWTTRYTTLRQVTAADVADAVTAVKGPRAHERAVALRSLFRALKHAKLVFTDPTRGIHVTRRELLPATLTPYRLAGLLDTRTDPAGRLALALTALHATNGTDLRNLTLADLLLARGQLLLRRPHGRRHTIHLDETTTALLHAWLRYRHKRWPRTANPHLLITQQTASTTEPVSTFYISSCFTPGGLTLRSVRADRILDEARETEDPVHLIRVFGISTTTAMKYIHTAHPHRAGPIPH